MPRSRDSWVFGLTLSAAAAILVSIAGGETLLAAALLGWILHRPNRLVWPSYFVPLCAFMATTVLALIVSPQPAIGTGSVRKFFLFATGLLAANLVNSEARARLSLKVLVLVAAVASGLGLIQFGTAYFRFLATHELADDPTVLARITGFMGHWLTFSGEQVLVWCAAVPAMLILGRRWMIPLAVISAGLIFSFTRSVWLGAIGGFIAVALLIPRRVLMSVALPIMMVAIAASGLIAHRLSFSLQQQFGPDTGRFELFIGGVRMIQDHPLFGVGPERVPMEFQKYYRGKDLAHANFYYGHLENNILQLAAERGLLCLAAFLWFIFELYASLIEMLKRAAADDSRWVILSALSALTAFIIAGLFSYNFGDSEVLLLLLFIVSLPYGVNGKTGIVNVAAVYEHSLPIAAAERRYNH